MTTGNFVDPPKEGERMDFAAESPKGAIKEQGQGGSGRFSGPRSSEAPKAEIEKNRDIVRTDPHVHEGLYTLIDWICGDGFNLSPSNVPGTGIEQTEEDIASIALLLHNSEFWRVFNQWVEYAAQDGHSFMELVVQDERFLPRVLPTERMHKKTDEYGFVTKYALEPPGGGGPDDDDATIYEPHEVAELWFTKDPTDDFGRSFVEPIQEQADMLRDMEFDYARFVATKAYPPILWKLGTDEEQWSEDQIGGWLDTVEQIEPDSMLAAPHDVDYDVVGVTSTSSSAGAMKLEGTFEHLQNRIVTGLGVPALLMNMDGSTGEATASMPAFKRRIKRLQNIVKSAVENQILKSLMVESSLDEFDGVVPEFGFGEHSSAEKRLEIDKLIKLYQSGFLTREAFAERAGIDPEVELPSPDELSSEIIPLITELAGRGDRVQNPDGGRPTDTGTGVESAGGEVKSRESGRDSSNERNRQSITEDENA
ncbi:portal protein [Halorubrum virus HRTV-22]|nr:portal protein [Halorubrum virus HRTV-22]